MNRKEMISILKINGIDLSKKHIILKDKKFDKKDVYILGSTFDCFTSNHIKPKNMVLAHRVDLIYYLFSLNVFKYSFFGLILPLIVFLIISLISFSIGAFFQGNANFGLININESQRIILFFLSSFFILICLILLYKLILRKERVVFTKINGHRRYQHISNKEYINRCAIFEEYINTKEIYFKSIESDRLIIREFKYSDYNDVYEYASSLEVNQYMSTDVMKDINQSHEYIQNCLINYEDKLIYRLAIHEKSLNKVIGYIGLSKKDLSLKTCQVVYAINKEYWHKGYTSEALNLFISYLEGIGKEYIIGGHVQENIYSGKVLEKCGFKRESSKDYDLIIKDKLCHIYTYILDLRKEESNNEEQE